MADPVDNLKLASNALLVAQTELEKERVQLPPHEAFGLISTARRNIDKVISYTTASDELPPAPAVPADEKSPKENKHPIAPQEPSLPDGADYDDAEGGIPEKQPGQGGR